MKDNNAYVNTYFRIDCMKDNYNNEKAQEDIKKFYIEVTEVLSKLGFEFKDINKLSSGHCPNGYRGFENLYCHPQMVSGYINKECLTEIETALKDAKTFKFRFTDTYQEVKNYTQDEYLEALKDCKEEIEDKILKMFETKRKNLFIHESAIYNIKSSLKYEDNWKNGLKAIESSYIEEVFLNLIEQGKLEKAIIKSGNGYRTVKIKESKKAKIA